MIAKRNFSRRSQSGFVHMAPMVVVALALLVGTVGLAYTRISKAATMPTRVSVGTYNLRSQRWDGQSKNYDNWSVRRPRVMKKIGNTRPGIVGMQEVIARNPDTGRSSSQRSDVVVSMKGLGYAGYVGSMDNSSPVFWNTANFNRSAAGEYLVYDGALSNRQDKPADRYLTFVRLQQVHTKARVLVLNYHFSQWDQVDSQLSKLAKDVSVLHSRYPNDPIFFTGDFNKHDDDVIRVLARRGVDLRKADKYRGIDHVLVSRRVAVRDWVNTGLGSPAASDHPLIIAKLTI